MSEYKVKGWEVVKEFPGNPNEKGGPAKVMRFILEGTEKQPELFATAKTHLPVTGDVVKDDDLVWNDQWNRWEFRKKDTGKSGGGFKRSPGETKAIQRQHSEEMGLRREANIIAAGGRPYTEEQLRNVINWFEQDIASKNTSVAWDGFSDDVPVDDSDLPWGGRNEKS